MRRRTVLRTAAAGLVVPAVAVPGVATPAGAAPAAAPAADPDLGAVLAPLLEAVHAAGMPGAFAEVRDGARSWPLAAGVADLDTRRPVEARFQHRVGSTTKTLVATVVLQLVRERRVELDAPIGRYLPDVVPAVRGRQITLRMLLNHTSGIGNYTNALLPEFDDIVRVGNHTFTPRDLVTLGLILPPTNAPGGAWSYSNTNYIILGLLIERLTGRRYTTEIERRILRPLGLRETYFPGTDPRIRGPHSKAYMISPDGPPRDFSRYNMSWAWAAGEMISTPADLNRFYRALLSGRLLTPALLTEMQTTVPVNPAVPAAGGYGLGLLQVTGLPCGTAWGHTGGTIGHTTVSLHSGDGTRQVTLAENLIGYTPPLQPHPIDEARAGFLITALCGPPPAGTRTPAAQLNLPLTRLTDVVPPAR